MTMVWPRPPAAERTTREGAYPRGIMGVALALPGIAAAKRPKQGESPDSRTTAQRRVAAFADARVTGATLDRSHPQRLTAES